MLKLRSGLVVLLLVGVLCCTPLLQGDTVLDTVDEETNPFSPAFFERFYGLYITSVSSCLDLENDGDMDYAYGAGSSVFICENKGVFTKQDELACQLYNDFYAETIMNGGISSGDLNGDGHMDLVLGGNFGNLRVVENNGCGGFKEGKVIWGYHNRSAIQGIDIADWDGDGHNDIIFLNCTSVKVVYNLGSGIYSEPTELGYLDVPAIMDLRVKDFDNDNDMDILLSCSDVDNDWVYFVNSTIVLLRNDGTDTFTQSVISHRGDGEFHNMDTRIHPRLAVADFDQDGDEDIAFGDNSGIVELLLNNGDGSFNEEGILCDVGNISKAIASDYDMDGDIDIVVSTEGHHLGVDGGFYVIYNNLNPMSLQTPQPNHMYLFNRQLRPDDSSLLIGPTKFRVNRQVETDYVEFYVNDKLMHTDSSYPFEWRWSKLHFGEAHVKIIGYFADGTTYTLQDHYTKFF